MKLRKKWPWPLIVLFLFMAVSMIVTMAISYYFSSSTDYREANPLPKIQWLQSVLINLGTGFFSILFTVWYVDSSLSKYEESQWKQAELAASQHLIDLTSRTLKNLSAALKKMELEQPMVGIDPWGSPERRLEQFILSRAAISRTLRSTAKDTLLALVTEDSLQGQDRLSASSIGITGILNTVEEWLRLFGHRMDPETTEALIQVRWRLKTLESLVITPPVGHPDEFPEWRKRGEEHWAAILTCIDTILNRFCDNNW